MTRRFLPVVLAISACAPLPSERAAPAGGDELAGPPAVILFIGDGAGLTYWSAMRLASSAPLGVESLGVIGLVDTRSARSYITDSAAGATAFASGVRTYNGAIGVGPDTVPVRTVLEVARDRGWGTGLVSTAAVTHATPAAFAAHVPSRGMYEEIASQLAARPPQVLLGGGRRYFTPAHRADGADLLTPLVERMTYVEEADAFFALDTDTVQALVGLFANDQPGPAAMRSPDLAQLTRAALAVLEREEEGFFLMVEGAQIDWRGHENALLPEVLTEMYDFDLAIRAAVEFQRRRPNTLILVTADHETGGLALHGGGRGGLTAHYTTGNHTAGMVPLFAAGPGAPAFGGIIDNDEVGRLLLRSVRDDRPLRALAH